MVLRTEQYARMIVVRFQLIGIGAHALANLVRRLLALDHVRLIPSARGGRRQHRAERPARHDAPVMRLLVDRTAAIERLLVRLDAGARIVRRRDVFPFELRVLVAERDVFRHVVRTHQPGDIGVPGHLSALPNLAPVQIGLVRRFQLLAVDEANVVALERCLQRHVLAGFDQGAKHRAVRVGARRQSLKRVANRHARGRRADGDLRALPPAVLVALEPRPHALKEALRLKHRHRGHRFAPAGRRAIGRHLVGHAERADPAHLVEADHGIFRAKVQIDLAAVVALVERDPVLAALVRPLSLRLAPVLSGPAARMGRIDHQFGQLRNRMRLARHRVDDVDQRLELRVPGLLAAVLGELQAVRRIDHDDAIDAALPLLLEHRLREQRDDRALAVPHHGDRFVSRIHAVLQRERGGPDGPNGPDEARQASRGQHEIATIGRLAGEDRIAGQRVLHDRALELVRFEARAVHLRNVVRRVGEKPAALAEMGVEPVAVDVLILAARHQVAVAVRHAALDLARMADLRDLVVGRPIAPVERQEHAVSAAGLRTLIQIHVRIAQHFRIPNAIALGFRRRRSRIPPAIRPRPQIASRQALIEPLAQPALHGGISRPGIVDAVDEDHHARQIARNRHGPVAGPIRHRHARPAGGCETLIVDSVHRSSGFRASASDSRSSRYASRRP
ncbi:Uncharacterised protein [Burkholderia pseudomallei]|nr:Uncharacterised protein [Burkholderia pseudomallei]